MSQLSEAWCASQQGIPMVCPRYNIIITGCTRGYVCKSESIQACFNEFRAPISQERYKHLSSEKTLRRNPRALVRAHIRSPARVQIGG